MGGIVRTKILCVCICVCVYMFYVYICMYVYSAILTMPYVPPVSL